MKKLILSILILVSLSFGYNNSDMHKEGGWCYFTNFSSGVIYTLLPDYINYLGEMSYIEIGVFDSEMETLMIGLENGYIIRFTYAYSLKICDENGVEIASYVLTVEEQHEYIKSIYFYLTDK